MARTIEIIRDEIIASKDANTTLSTLNSGSASSIFRLIAYVVATAIWIHESLVERFQDEVEASIAARQTGTAPWYVDRIFDFQLGDTLQVINGVATYATIDPDKKIITRCSYEEAPDGDAIVLLLKVAKGEIGSEEPLTSLEQYALRTYLDRIKFAGTKTQIVSLNADKLRLTAEVFYDGIRPQEEVQAEVEAALNNYLLNLDFNGSLYINKLIDAIQGVDGVIDASVTTAVAVVGVIETTINRVYDTQAGYIIQDPTVGNTFSDTITYTPQNV